ncbi:hypothetical protein AB4Z46_23465 [Variovorax sp. M-6]
MIVWDNGTWEPVGDRHDGLKKGKLVFHMHGQNRHSRLHCRRSRAIGRCLDASRR